MKEGCWKNYCGTEVSRLYISLLSRWWGRFMLFPKFVNKTSFCDSKCTTGNYGAPEGTYMEKKKIEMGEKTLLRSFAECLCSPEKLWVSLQNFLVPPRNFAITSKTFVMEIIWHVEKIYFSSFSMRSQWVQSFLGEPNASDCKSTEMYFFLPI